MAPKGAIRGTGVGRPVQPKGYAQQVYAEITDPENRSVVTSLAFFAVRIISSSARMCGDSGSW